MNSFSHAVRFLERDPQFVVGTSVPDWLTMVDRRVRARRRLAAPIANDPGHPHAELAAGIVQHHVDDSTFHGNPVFAQLNLDFALEIRERQAPGDAGGGTDESHALSPRDSQDSDSESTGASFRPHFAAHILIEMLLDSCLANVYPGRLERYYGIVAAIDADQVQAGVNSVAVQSTKKLAQFVERFLEEKYIFDYHENRGVQYRLNRILSRIGLGQLDDSLLPWFAEARRQVDEMWPCLFPFDGDES